MTTNLEQTALEPQIAQLEAEIGKRQADIENLEEAIATLKANRPRPNNPRVDSTFELLKELIGAVPQNLEQQAIYQAKLGEVERSLELATAACKEKERELKTLHARATLQQQEQAFEQLKSKAGEFNNLIDGAMALLEEMRELSSAARGKLEVVSDLKETPYCSINETFVRVRRRFDVIRG